MRKTYAVSRRNSTTGDIAIIQRDSVLDKTGPLSNIILQRLSQARTNIGSGELSKEDIVTMVLIVKQNGPIDKKQALTSIHFIMMLTMVVTTFTFPYFIISDYREIANEKHYDNEGTYRVLIDSQSLLSIVIILSGICNSIGRF